MDTHIHIMCTEMCRCMTLVSIHKPFDVETGQGGPCTQRNCKKARLVKALTAEGHNLSGEMNQGSSIHMTSSHGEEERQDIEALVPTRNDTAVTAVLSRSN